MRVVLPACLERHAARALLALPPGVLRAIVGRPKRSPDGLELDPQVHALLRAMAWTNQPEVHQQGLERARRYMDRAASTLVVAGAGDVGARDTTVAGELGPRRARVYVPASRARDRASPGLVWFHGGGWVLGSIASTDGVCRALAKRAGLVVVSVDYRLAPEDPFPAATRDALAATRCVLDAGSAFGVDPRRLAVGGDSAGGNLAALVAQALRGEPRCPAFQILVYPATDLTRSHPSHRLFSDGYILTERAMDWYLAHYLPDAGCAGDPLASPFFGSDLSGLPPAFVLTAGFDPLRDEGREYAAKMRAAGVAADHVCAEGLIHGFFAMTGAVRQAERMLDLAACRLKAALCGRDLSG